VLGRAFELIGTPDKRHAYDIEVHKTKVTVSWRIGNCGRANVSVLDIV